jgi:hypothetical protein
MMIPYCYLQPCSGRSVRMRDSELIERFVLLSWKELVERKRSLMVVCGKSSEEGEEKKWGGGGGG